MIYKNSRTSVFCAIGMLTILMSAPVGADKLSDNSNFEVFDVYDFSNSVALGHIEEAIVDLNLTLGSHNLIVSEILLAPVKTREGEDTGGVRARSAPDEEFAGEQCVTLDHQGGEPSNGTRTCAVFFENPD